MTRKINEKITKEFFKKNEAAAFEDNFPSSFLLIINKLHHFFSTSVHLPTFQLHFPALNTYNHSKL
jgi:hypothetical protein